MLAAGWASADKSAMDWKREFYKAPTSWDTELWFGLSPLPQLPSSVPSWFQEIIDCCYRENPNERPSCGDLLAKFPSAILDTEADASDYDPQKHFALQDGSYRGNGCDHCRVHILSTLYHCAQCGDADVCLECFDKGKHCEDSGHLLIEIHMGRPLPIATRYHTSADTSGKRRVYVY
jgi:serine/threonine protein kinase